MVTIEKLKGRLVTLKQRHKDLHKKIEVLEAEKAPDKIITNYKKKKLALKDEISKLNVYISQ